MSRIARAVKKVEGLQPDKPKRTPREENDQMPWLKVISKAREDCGAQWVYTVDVYVHPYDATPVKTGVKMLNAAEKEPSAQFIPTNQFVKATDILRLDLGDGAGPQPIYLCRVELFGLLVGQVTEVSACNGFVSATSCGQTWTVYLRWPSADVYQKHVQVGDQILFFELPNSDPEFPSGIAVGVEKDYVSLREDGEPKIRKISDINIVNAHGADDRKDFDDADLVQPNEFCEEETQFGLRWRGNTVFSYPASLEEIRNFRFSGADENPGVVVPQDLLCVRFKTEKTDGPAASSTGITAKITATVPIMKVATSQMGKWLEIGGGGCGGETAGGNPTISHIGPDGDSEEEIPVPMTLSLTGCTIKLQPPTIKVDATGHFIGFGTGSPGNSTEIEIPHRTLTVVTSVTQSGCNINVTDEEVKVLDC